MSAFDPRDVETLAGEILRAGPICDECLGRIASRLGSGLRNAERGRRIREHLTTHEIIGVSGRCWVCDDAFLDVERWAQQAADRISETEFATYLFGVKLTAKQEQMESFYEERFPSPHREPMKHSLNRAMGIAFEQQLSHPATVDFSDPHVSFVVDLASDSLSCHVRSLYLYGRYRKLERGIPQTRWPCRSCRGRGCEACRFTGKQYPISVEELIGTPLCERARAKMARLHGAGREDIDARMLGSGRPFVLELVAPNRRTIEVNDSDELVREYGNGRVEIDPLRFVGRRAVRWVKSVRSRKRYRAQVALGDAVTASAFAVAVQSLVGEITQRTPLRVSHRRADRVRHRVVHAAEGALRNLTSADVEIDGDGGLYIKELISGDEGRTTPSLSGQLGVAARVTALDVLAVKAPDLPKSMELPDGLS